MIVPQSHLLPGLEQNALWLVIDPFKEQPKLKSGELPPVHIDAYNNEACIKIRYYLKDVLHKFVRLLNEHEQNAHLNDYPRMNSSSMLNEYMRRNNLTKIVYCGFHYGICIHNTNIGIAAMHNRYECFLKHDLSFVYPSSTNNELPSYCEADKLTQSYGTIIV